MSILEAQKKLENQYSKKEGFLSCGLGRRTIREDFTKLIVYVEKGSSLSRLLSEVKKFEGFKMEVRAVEVIESQ